ncbi:MAG TPA: HypC/HybG/HupF family hydrogenase formation chaperone [Candidatus Limnocylindrales bacterium]|nr:HypC/HybG/HupF family hydrogenase formation chaperone [Candidatus Limnocylindrales bacterium]
MCLGIPGRIVELPADRPDLGRVDVEGVVRDINMLLLADDPPAPGDWVLIHLGFALEKMTEAQVAEVRSTRILLSGGEGGALPDLAGPDGPAPAPIGELAS